MVMVMVPVLAGEHAHKHVGEAVLRIRMRILVELLMC